MHKRHTRIASDSEVEYTRQVVWLETHVSVKCTFMGSWQHDLIDQRAAAGFPCRRTPQGETQIFLVYSTTVVLQQMIASGSIRIRRKYYFKAHMLTQSRRRCSVK